MKRISSLILVLLVSVVFTALADMQLPVPNLSATPSLGQCLQERKTARDFADKPLPPEVLSSLLWAANGINRPDGHRTAPTGMNVQDIDIYVILADGCYFYDAKANSLKLIKEGDFRVPAGRQPFVKDSPVNLIYVQDTARSMKADEATQARHGGIHAGAIMQNVYLFCAAEKLSCVARDSMDRDALREILALRPEQKIMLAQTIGYAKAEATK